LTARQLLTGLSTSPAMIERQPGFCSFFQELLTQQKIYANAGMTDIDGNVICSAVPKTHPVSFSDRVWYREVRKGDGVVVGDYHHGVMMNVPVVIVAKPILGKGGEHLAYLFVSVDLSWFNRRTLGDQLPKDAELYFYNNKRVILHSEPAADRWRGRSVDTAIREIGTPDSETGVVEAYGGDGVLRLFSYARLEGSAAEDNAVIAVGIPADAALARTRRIGGMVVLVILGVFGVMLLFAWVGTGRLVIAPVRQLIHQANAHAAGDLSRRSGMAQDSELGRLGHALDKMAVNLEKNRDELAQHIRALNEHAIVSAADTAGNIIYANDKFCEISQGRGHR
jgi:HAMP domain-containing protein